MRSICITLILFLNGIFIYAQQTKVFIPISHEGTISSAIKIPGKNFIVSAGPEGNIKVWDIDLKRLVKTMQGHIGYVSSLCLHPDGNSLVSCGDRNDQSIRIWDIEQSIEIGIIKNAHSDIIHSVSINPNGKTIVSCSQDRYIKLWDFETKKLINSYYYNDKNSTPFCVKFSPDGKNIVVGGDEKFIRIFDNNLNSIGVIEHESFDIKCLEFTKDGKKLISGGEEMKIIVWKFPSGKKVKVMKEKDYINALTISDDGKYLASATGSTNNFDNGVKVWDVESLKCLKNFKPYVFNNNVTFRSTTVTFLNNNKEILVGTYRIFVEYDFDTEKEKNIYQGYEGYYRYFAKTSDNQLFAISGNGSNILIWDNINQRPLAPINTGFKFIRTIKITKDNRLICFASNESKIQVWRLSTKQTDLIKEYQTVKAKRICLHPDEKSLFIVDESGNIDQIFFDGSPNVRITTITDPSISDIDITSDGNYMALSKFYMYTMDIVNIKEKKVERVMPLDGFVNTVAFAPDNKTLAISSSGRLQLIDVISNTKINESTGCWAEEMNYSNDGKYIVSGGMTQKVQLWDAFTCKEIKEFIGHEGTINDLNFNNASMITSVGADGKMILWDIENGKSICQHIVSPDKWLIYNNDGYYDCSQDAGEMLSINKGLQVFNIDQFALKYNRPDILFAPLKQVNPEVLTHYNNQFKKRLRRSGLVEDDLSTDLHIPTVTLINSAQNGHFLDVSFNLKDDKYKLIRYNIFVNDIPLFGEIGKPVRGKEAEVSEKIELINGKNKIEITCFNEKGVESLRPVVYADCNKNKLYNLYLLAFGVSKYQNPVYNLQYAAKDATDLASTIDSLKGKGFENVYIKVLTNEQVTPEAIKATKDFVKDAKPDDTFILFIAGHGMHDKDAEATYYYLTYGADVNNLKATAADFETIEDLLQGIPPRNKLFLMDACESGEIDEEEQGQMLATATGAGIASRGFKKTGVEPVETSSSTLRQAQGSVAGKRSYLYQKDRYIYNDLVRRSGAIVFSSSKGGELSYERSDIENGLFTEAIMKALTTTEADKDGNSVVSTDELRNYVISEVAKASGDLQHPTVDKDNIYQKFGFGIK